MTDTISPARRSALMSRIRSADTQPEMVVRRIVHGLGYRYVLHDRRLPGRPDLVFPSRRKVVFVHGCFWHGHTCALASSPKSNATYWSEKIAANKARDRRHRARLKAAGWTVLAVYECAIRRDQEGRVAERLISFLEP